MVKGASGNQSDEIFFLPPSIDNHLNKNQLTDETQTWFCWTSCDDRPL